MKKRFLILIAVFVIPVTQFVVDWGGYAIGFGDETLAMLDAIVFFLSLCAAVIAGWFVWKNLENTQSNLLVWAISGGAVIGAIGFHLGFYGTIIFTPEANQGPLLGIFYTGPLGVFLGIIAGVIGRNVVNKKK